VPRGNLFGNARRKYLFQLAFVVAAYYAAAQVGYAFRFAGPVAALVWLPVGAGIALLYLLGPQLWPAVVLGDLLVNDYSALPIGSAVGQTFGNLVEVLGAALLLRWFASRRAPLGTMGGLFDLLIALVGATALSATLGLSSLLAGHAVELAAVPRLWRTWWLGDLCGALIIVPFAIAWFSPSPQGQPSRPIIEPVLLTIVLLGLIMLAWRADITLYYTLVPLVWAAVRFGPRGATLAIVLASGFAIWTTGHALGPFTYRVLHHSLVDVQAYLVLSAVVTLGAAALVQEHSRLAARLRASRARIVAIADEERRRIERNIHDGAQQQLVALAAHLSLAAGEIRTDPASAAAALERAQTDLQLAIDDLRELAHGVRPTALRKLGLATAIGLAAARSAATVELDLDGLPDERLDDTVEATAYFVVLEAITNAQRHAHASVVKVRVLATAGSLAVEITDDGVGGAVEHDHFGLQGLRDRVEAVDGEFLVESQRSDGTRVAARIPLHATG
jgi:signal transduction histidine kinase